MSRKFYLVVRLTWSAGHFYEGSGSPNYDERIPVRGFVRKAAAETLCQELNAEFQREHDPWLWFGSMWGEAECEPVKSAAIHLGLISADVDRYGWWRDLKAPLTPEQRSALWAAVPGAKVYEVIETKLID